jgi:WD40 repeat protein
MIKFFDAFISYGRADSKEFAEKLQKRLNEQGFKVWFDQADIPYGVDYQRQIDDGIEKAHNFLFIIAPHSVKSPYCRKEIELAVKRHKRIIPLLHVKADEFKEQTHPIIRKLNWLWFQEGINDFDKSLADLINIIQKHDEYIKQHTQFLANALEWERNQKQTSCLLIGEEKQQAQAWLKRRFKDEQPPCVPTDLHCEYITESIKNANNLMTQVIISYADEDRATMEKIRNSLRRESITVWTNTTDIQTGEAFEEAIKRGIEQADNVVYLLSPDSVKSYFARQELEYALSLNKRIVPVLVREISSESIPNALRDLQYIDLTNNVLEEDYHLDESQLLRILRQDEAYYNEHKVLLTKALKWKRQHSNPSILLRGYNLHSAQTWLNVVNKRTLHPPTALMEEFINESLRQPPAISLDVFISYSRADADFARKLNDELQLQGKTTWFDQESIASGADFAQEIRQGIQACDNFLFILSPRSVNSPYCADEVEYAASLNKRFVTVLHRPMNSDELHPELAKVQWIDFHQNPGDFPTNFRQLVRTLDTDREHLHNHTKWSQRAIEWNEKDKSADLLLRGSEFAIAQNWLQESEQQKKQPAATPLQKAFIEASKNAIAAAEEDEKRRQAEMLRLQEERTKEAEARLVQERKSARQQKIWLGAVSTALVAAIAASFMAFGLYGESERQRTRAETVTEGQIKALSQFSLVLNDTDQKLDALIEAIRAEEQLQKQLDRVQPETRSQVLTALQATVYGDGFREHNRLTGHNSGVYGVSFSPNGRMIATASADSTVKLWSENGKQQRTLTGHTAGVNSVVWSPDGQTIATASADKTVKLWSLDGKLLHILIGHKAGVNSVVWSPDGQTIATASADKTIKLWSVDGKELRTLTGHKTGVDSVSFSPDSKTIATASADKTVKLWSVDGKELRTLTGYKAGVYSVNFSPNGKTIASADADNTIKLWSLDGKERQTLKGHTKPVYSVSFSLDGKTIVSASADNTIKLWSLDGKERQTLKGHRDVVWGVSFSPDGKTIASASLDGTVRLWRADGKELRILKGDTKAGDSVRFSPDGKTIATTSADNAVQIWSVETGKTPTLRQTLTGHKATVNSISFSPDGKTITFASDDKTVKLWSVDGKELRTLTGFTDWVYSVVWNPDGKTIAFGSQDGTIKLWSVQTGKMPVLRQTLTGHKAAVNSITFSPNGKIVVSASQDGTIKLWSVQTDKMLVLRQTLIGHKAAVNSVVWNADGTMIASASDDTTVKVWSVNGKELQTLIGHTDWVNSVVWSPDGDMIASASLDGTIKLWSVQTDKMLVLRQTLVGHKAAVNSVVWKPDGKMIASASQEGTVILWNLEDLHLDKLMQDACEWVGDYLKYNSQESDRHLCGGVGTPEKAVKSSLEKPIKSG